MIPENMLLFLSKENITAHIGYMNTLFAKYSILEKSIPKTAGKTPAELYRMRLDNRDKREMLSLLTDYLSHKTYFSSFAKNDRPSKEIKRYFSSENDFCYRVVEKARGERDGFIYIIKDKNGSPVITHSSELPEAYIKHIPILALDLCEHAYFADYGFQRDEYIRRAVSRLDISKLFIRENT